MYGKVKSIDVYENVGTLANEDGEELLFSLDDCVGFSDIPEIGTTVTYGLNQGEIYFVEPFTCKEDSQSPTLSHAQEESPINPQQKRKKTFNADISLDVDIPTAISNYFSEVSYSISDYDAWFEEHEELNYALMKRFLHTAYNNLVEMDSGFMDEELIELHSDLQALDKIYIKLKKKNTAPKVAFETIFLEKQRSYIENKKRLESNSSEIFTLESSMKRLEEQINKTQEYLSKISISNENFLPIENELKRYKTYYVDTLHKVATLKDENIALKEGLVRFANRYEEEFLELYTKKSDEYFGEIERLLDGYAYVFDKKMWERAENSSAITSFFKKAHIEDEFSSKTFLKYFLRTLDETKMSSEQKKLEDLLFYLESRAKMRFLIIHEVLAELDVLKHTIRALDKDYSVESVDKPRSVYYRKDLKIIDVIFIDTTIKNPTILEYLSMLHVRLKQTKSKALLCLLSKSVTKEVIILAKKFNIDAIISLDVSEDELKDDIEEIISGITK